MDTDLWGIRAFSLHTLALLGMQGLGYPQISVQRTVPPFTHMVERGLLAEPVFSFWFNR